MHNITYNLVISLILLFMQIRVMLCFLFKTSWTVFGQKLVALFIFLKKHHNIQGSYPSFERGGHLNMRNLHAKCPSRLLSNDYKRLTISRKDFAWFSHSSNKLLRHVKTIDKTQIHLNTPDTKKQSKQYVALSELVPKRIEVRLSASKVIPTNIWVVRGIIRINYPREGGTINGEYHAILLDKWRFGINDRIWQEENARSPKAIIMMKCHELYSQSSHYSDLALSEYF